MLFLGFACFKTLLNYRV